MPKARDGADPTMIALASAYTAWLAPDERESALELWREHEGRTTHLGRMEARFVLWRATRDRAHVGEAHRLLSFFRDHAPDEYGDSTVTNVPLHRDIMKALEEHGGKG